MYISLTDFLLTIIVFVIAALAIYLVITLRNLNSLIQSFEKLLEKNADSLTKSMTVLPETIKNIGAAAQSTQEQIEDIGSTVNVLGSNLLETATSLNEKTVSGISFVKTIVEVVAVIKDYIDSRRDD